VVFLLGNSVFLSTKGVGFSVPFFSEKESEPCSSVNGTAETVKGYNVSFFDTKERDAKKPPKGD
jgi:hypothetical protein